MAAKTCFSCRVTALDQLAQTNQEQQHSSAALQGAKIQAGDVSQTREYDQTSQQREVV